MTMSNPAAPRQRRSITVRYPVRFATHHDAEQPYFPRHTRSKISTALASNGSTHR